MYLRNNFLERSDFYGAKGGHTFHNDSGILYYTLKQNSTSFLNGKR